jgi:hypothetical protein
MTAKGAVLTLAAIVAFGILAEIGASLPAKPTAPRLCLTRWNKWTDKPVCMNNPVGCHCTAPMDSDVTL